MAPTTISEDRLTSGHRLSHPPPGDEILISGVSGYFPDSDSVIHLQENLFNKVCQKKYGTKLTKMGQIFISSANICFDFF